MKQLLSKIPALIAMLITLLSLFFYVKSFFNTESELGLVAVIVALFSVPFYFIDALISFVKAIKKNDAKFNYILTLIIIGLLPVSYFWAGSGKLIQNVTWTVYYLLVFVLEIISIQKICVVISSNKNSSKENAPIATE